MPDQTTPPNPPDSKPDIDREFNAAFWSKKSNTGVTRNGKSLPMPPASYSQLLLLSSRFTLYRVLPTSGSDKKSYSWPRCSFLRQPPGGGCIEICLPKGGS